MLTIVCQEVGGYQPRSLLQGIEPVRDFDERSRHYCRVQG